MLKDDNFINRLKFPKQKEKTARLKKERTQAKSKAPLPEKTENISVVCEEVKVPL